MIENCNHLLFIGNKTNGGKKTHEKRKILQYFSMHSDESVHMLVDTIRRSHRKYVRGRVYMLFVGEVACNFILRFANLAKKKFAPLFFVDVVAIFPFFISSAFARFGVSFLADFHISIDEIENRVCFTCLHFKEQDYSSKLKALSNLSHFAKDSNLIVVETYDLF